MSPRNPDGTPIICKHDGEWVRLKHVPYVHDKDVFECTRCGFNMSPQELLLFKMLRDIKKTLEGKHVP